MSPDPYRAVAPLGLEFRLYLAKRVGRRLADVEQTRRQVVEVTGKVANGIVRIGTAYIR